MMALLNSEQNLTLQGSSSLVGKESTPAPVSAPTPEPDTPHTRETRGQTELGKSLQEKLKAGEQDVEPLGISTPTKPEQSAPEQPAQGAGADYEPVALSLGDYLNFTFPPKQPLLGTDSRQAVLRSREVLMLYAFRGTGKTRFANFLAVCLASGKQFLKWPIGKEGIKVLYIDGELDGEEQQERWPQAVAAAGADIETVKRNLFVMNKFIQKREVIPPFNTPEGRAFYINACRGYDVVFCDSIASFFPRGRKDWDNAAELMNQTLEQSRDANGCAQVLIQHEGKDGSQIGSVQNERLVSVSWRLKEIKEDDAIDGSHVELTFEKKRNLFGADVESLDIKYINNSWSWSLATEERDARICDMARNGMKQVEIAKEVGLNQSRVAKILKAAGIKSRDFR